jgi:hypothetical protein
MEREVEAQDGDPDPEHSRGVGSFVLVQDPEKTSWNDKPFKRFEYQPRFALPIVAGALLRAPRFAEERNRNHICKQNRPAIAAMSQKLSCAICALSNFICICYLILFGARRASCPALFLS